MRKKLIILAVLVGFLWNVAVYVKTLSYTFSYPNNDSVSLDCADYIEVIALEGGVPLESATKKSYIVQPCNGSDSPSKLDMTMMLMTTPQFYVNWVIWSGLLVGPVYIFTRKKS